MQEDYYPRGGVRPKFVNGTALKCENLFNTLQKSGQKKRKRTKKRDMFSKSIENVDLRLTCAELLSYDKILSDMVILACVRNVSPYNIQVELPGRTFAKVEIHAISSGLTNFLLEKAENSTEDYIVDDLLQILSTIFIQRQFLPVFIMEITENDDRIKRIQGSVIPEHVNSHLKYDSFTKGMLIWGSIQEKSDYVYNVNLGVKHTRAILPFKHCGNKIYTQGEPSWFIIRELRIQNNTATITLGSSKDDLAKAVMQDGHLDQMIPGMCVEFVVTKVLKDGLEGTYFSEYLGYINQIYLDNPMESLEKYENKTVRAYILYIHPITKITFLTMRNLHLPHESPVLQTGHIAPVKITHNIGKGVIVKFKKNEIGLVTHKRLINSLKLQDSSQLASLIKTKFPIGSTHNCRILDYISMDKMYICTFEQSVIKETVFSRNDLKLGQLVKGTIEGINNSGVTVKIGKLVAFATNEHLSNVQYSDNIKKNYKLGNYVDARILDIKGNNIKVTLKQSFVQDDKCLTTYEMAKKNDEYKGMVVKTYEKGALLRFYGDVKGWLAYKNSSIDCKNMFYEGQVINVTISSIKDTKLLLTLDPPEKLQNQRKLQIGHFTSGTVESLNSNGIFVRTNHGDTQGFLHVNHLSINCSLSNAMLNLFQLGNKIEDLICIAKDKKRILSRREYTYYKSNKYQVLRRNQLKPGMLLRCSVKSYNKKQLLLTSPIVAFTGYIRVNKQDIIEDDELLKDLNFTTGQAVVAKITAVDEVKVMATVKLKEVYDYDCEYPVDYLKRYLNEVEDIQQRLVTSKDPIAQYSIGQRVVCQIKKINDIGCSVSLEDGVRGIVAPEHWPNKPLIGSSHEGVILYVNLINKYLEISLNNSTNQKISKTQGDTSGVKLNETIYAKILLIRPEFVLCSLNQHGNKQIGYMPTILHENDFKPDYSYYSSLTGTFKFVIVSIVNGKIIGLEKNWKQNLEKTQQLSSNASNKRRKSNGVIEHSKPSKRIRLSSDENISKELPDNFNRYISSNTNTDESTEEEDDAYVNSEIDTDQVELKSIQASEISKENEDNEDIQSSQEKSESITIESDTDESEDTLDDQDESEIIDISDSEEINEIENDDETCTDTVESSSIKERVENEYDEYFEEWLHTDEDESFQEGPQSPAGGSTDDENTYQNSCSDIPVRTLSTSESSEDSSQPPRKMNRVSFVEKVEKRLFLTDDNSRTFIPPGVHDFFDSDDDTAEREEAADEENIKNDIQPKRRKLTRAEQTELIREQEEELRKKELEFAEPTGVPQSAEQFDRRLLAEPNSSELWVQYISFHLASTEIEKARAVVKRALQTINVHADQELLNVWITAMNLENQYGTNESFAEVFSEAVRRNDDFAVYTQAIQIKSSSDSTGAEEYIKKACAKFKQNPKMYVEIGRIYYMQKRLVEARKLKDKALRTLTNAADHIPLIVKFAIMEFEFGEDNQAEALFETILQSTPKRVDVWCVYIDQLVKKGKIDIARRVLQRAATQKLKIKKMKTLHKKYRDFEQVYGNDETRVHQELTLKNYLNQFPADSRK